jgi:chaperonin GroEL
MGKDRKVIQAPQGRERGLLRKIENPVTFENQRGQAVVYRPKIDPNLAFVLMPFKPPFDSYYEEIIKPAAKAAGLETRKADEIYSTGPIIRDIWNQIWRATVVIADVTGKNPNVNYELGICHTLGVPTVIITQNFDDVPFDYSHRRCIRYNTTEDVHWQRRLKKSITETLKEVLAGENVSPELGWPYDTSPLYAGQKVGPLVPASDAREVVIRGVRMVRDAVAYAYGPHGSHVCLNIGMERRYYRKGAAIASSIHSSEQLEEIGISHASDVAREMRNTVGDGSKTAILLFQRMLELGSIALSRNHRRSEVLRGMDRATEAAVSAIRSKSKSVNRTSLMQLARTAANGDTQIAALVVEAYSKSGRDGLIVIERSDLSEPKLQLQEGMHFDQGYIDAAMASPTEIHESVLENAYILTHEDRISSMRDLLPLLEQVSVAKRPLLIIAADVEGEALATVVVNRKKGTLDCLAVRAPGYGDRRKAMLQDIAVRTGATTITSSSGRKLESVTIGDLGSARKVIVTRQDTTILGGAGDSNVTKHVETIREQLSRSRNPYDIEKLRERLATLAGAIAAIRIGGINSQEAEDRTYSAESAMHSVQKAIEEGVVVGGGLSLLKAKGALTKLALKKPGEVAGLNAIANALEEPIRQLLLNSGSDPVDTLKMLNRSKSPGTGFNSETSKVQDLEAAGILDPVATVTYAVRLASSHARTLLETAAWDSTSTKEQKRVEVTAAELVTSEATDSKQ